MSGEELLAVARKHMWAAWQLSAEELASQAASTLLGLGMLVPEGGAAELEKLRARVAELEAAALEGRSVLAAFCHDLDDPGSNAFGALFLLQQATPSVPMQRCEPKPKVFRASHDSIQMGLYLTAAAARAHCEAMERRAWAPKAPSFDWIEDEEEGIAELTVFVMGKEWQSGYVVTEVPVSAEYDEEADE
ncbi:hypothetical protein ABZX68_06375 [Streptomyces cellulosae]